jgi:hypothetical protein
MIGKDMQRHELRKRKATTASLGHPPRRGSSRKMRCGLTPPVLVRRMSPVLQPGRPAPPIMLGCTPHVALGHGRGAPLSLSTGPVGPRRRGGEAARSQGSLSLSLSLSSPFPLTYKKGRETPCRGDGTFRLTFTHAHSTRDLGALSLSLSRPFVTPTANLVQEHKRLELDVGTFYSNQYKPSDLSCTPSGPDAQSQNSVVGGSRHRRLAR